MFIAKPRHDITTDELLRLIFGNDTAQIESDYESTGWFINLIEMMKGEFEIGSVNRNGILCYVIVSGVKFEFEADEFHEYYEVKEIGYVRR